MIRALAVMALMLAAPVEQPLAAGRQVPMLRCPPGLVLIAANPSRCGCPAGMVKFTTSQGDQGCLPKSEQ
jgi:hypothetical protein